MAEPSPSRPRPSMDLQLPDDLLADILARLPPCSLAMSRCVRKHWRAIIDTRSLLRSDLLPLRLDGFFCLAEAPDVYDHTFFFARPSTGRRISAQLDFLDAIMDSDNILDHCNGLLLLWELVVNPATRQRVPLPPFPKPCVGTMERFFMDFFLAYDPMVSPHYDVLIIPIVPGIERSIKFEEDSEWPPSEFTLQVFSSTKWRWDERSFVREGEAAGTIADMHYTGKRHAVYLRGALYVHCHNDSVMRITLRNDNYRMIKSPADYKDESYLGKSEKGVYFGLLSQENIWPHRFRAWLLIESCGQMEWVLKNDISLQVVVENFSNAFADSDRYSTPWIVNYKKDVSDVQDEDDESEWDFDRGIVLQETNDKVGTCSNAFFLGFHPYKEIAFFLLSSFRVVSYRLNSSKVQELGILHEFISDSFPYTPCWMGVLFENN